MKVKYVKVDWINIDILWYSKTIFLFQILWNINDFIKIKLLYHKELSIRVSSVCFKGKIVVSWIFFWTEKIINLWCWCSYFSFTFSICQAVLTFYIEDLRYLSFFKIFNYTIFFLIGLKRTLCLVQPYLLKKNNSTPN